MKLHTFMVVVVKSGHPNNKNMAVTLNSDQLVDNIVEKLLSADVTFTEMPMFLKVYLGVQGAIYVLSIIQMLVILILVRSIRKNMLINRTKKFSRVEYSTLIDEDDHDDDEVDDIEMGSLKRSGSRTPIIRNSRVQNFSGSNECRDCQGVCVCVFRKSNRSRRK